MTFIITGDRSADDLRALIEPDAARGGDVDQTAGQAGGQGVQQVFHRGRTMIISGQYRRMIGVVAEALRALVLLTGAVVAVDLAAVVGAADPGVGGAELEGRQFGMVPDDVQGAEESGGVDAVAEGGLVDDGHDHVLSVQGSGVVDLAERVGVGRFGQDMSCTSAGCPAWVGTSCGRAAKARASRSMASLSCFCSSTNRATPGKAASALVRPKISPIALLRAKA